MLETEENFGNAIFYVIEGNVRNIISWDLAIQLGLLTLHNKATSKVISHALSTNDIYLGNDSKKKVTQTLLSKYHKAFQGVGKYDKEHNQLQNIWD